MKFRLFDRPCPDDPIMLAQNALGAESLALGEGLFDSIDKIVRSGLWQQGASYSEFGEFAAAPINDNGLDVRTVKQAKMLKLALMHQGHVREWTSVVGAIMRDVGRPETRDNVAGFQRFYKVDGSMNSQDRALISLRNHDPQLFEEVCQGRCSISAAAIKAGLKPGRPSPQAKVDLREFFAMKEEVQVTVLRTLFVGLDQETQAAFIAQVFEGALGTGLPQKWRQAQSQSGVA